MKLSFSWRRSICEGEEDDYSETNETLLEKENHYTTRRENPKSLLKLALAASIFFNLFLLILGVIQYWSQDSQNARIHCSYQTRREFTLKFGSHDRNLKVAALPMASGQVKLTESHRECCPRNERRTGGLSEGNFFCRCPIVLSFHDSCD